MFFIFFPKNPGINPIIFRKNRKKLRLVAVQIAVFGRPENANRPPRPLSGTKQPVFKN